MLVSPITRTTGVVFASTRGHQTSHFRGATAQAPSPSHPRRVFKVCRLASSSSAWVARTSSQCFMPIPASKNSCGYRALQVTNQDTDLQPEGKRIFVKDGKPVSQAIPLLEEGFVSVLKIVTNLFPLWVSWLACHKRARH